MGRLGLSTVTQTGAANAAQTGATITTPDGSDAATTQTLANAIKADYNKSITDIGLILAQADKSTTDNTNAIKEINAMIKIIQDKLL